MSEDQLILYCGCTWYDVLSEDVRGNILKSLKDRGARFVVVSDLCKMAAEKDPMLKEWARTDKITIVACFPRAVRSLFDFAGAKLPDDAVILNMRSQTAEDITSQLTGDSDFQGSFEKEGNWTPWFPVIDYGRCVNCKQCLNFCLFGVYALDDEGKVQVVRPANCKTNCPACARVCPECAIIFPKYGDSPINGDEVDESKVVAKPDLSGLTRDEILAKIRDRGKGRKRFAPAVDATTGQKLEHLKGLQDQLDIPQEVLDSLAKENNCPNSAFCDKDCDKTKGDKQHE